MALSKLEIQQMLREMNVKFDADETYEELKHRLQQENHSLWLKSVSGNRSANGDKQRVVVRKRRKKITAEDEASETVPHATGKTAIEKSSRHAATNHGRKYEAGYRPRPIEKPEPGQPWKSAADGTRPFNRTKNVFSSVLRRAKNCCERCGKPSDEGPHGIDLQPFYIQPLSEGGEHSIKNMVALCSACREAMDADPSTREIKELKRKTRSRLYDSLQVVRKKATAKRHRSPSYRD